MKAYTIWWKEKGLDDVDDIAVVAESTTVVAETLKKAITAFQRAFNKTRTVDAASQEAREVIVDTRS